LLKKANIKNKVSCYTKAMSKRIQGVAGAANAAA